MLKPIDIIAPKKLIEVAIPLDAINEAAAREKSIRHGHPSTLHLWWARRPLAAARAVIFAQLVNDPEDLWRCQNPGKEPNAQVKGHWTRSRNRLFKIIEALVQWENTTNEAVPNEAREAIRESWRQVCELNRNHPKADELFHPDRMPALHDPFAGGGSIPLEAQRLGLEAYASDLNPVAVLINKAMIEIPPKFAARPPVHPGIDNPLKTWSGAEGLAEDVRYYGQWMREEAEKRIGHLYPKIEITREMAQDRSDLAPFIGQKLTVIAWIWARTVRSPNPAFSDVEVPLASTFILSSKPGKEAYVEPIIENGSYRFTVKMGKPPEWTKNGTSAGRRQAFKCLISDTPIDYDYVRKQGKEGRIKQKLMAIVAEGSSHRVYLPPISYHEEIAKGSVPQWKPDLSLPDDTQHFNTPIYGMDTFGDLFTPRQLVALTTFSDLVGEAIEKCRQDALQVQGNAPRHFASDDRGLEEGGTGARAYSEALGVYLSFVVDKSADYWSSICSWHNSREIIRNTFGRQAIPMVWDYAETNPFSNATGNWMAMVDWTWKALKTVPGQHTGNSDQADVRHLMLNTARIFSTDPPYFDNIGYADLSDFFYVWLRKSLQSIYPSLFRTIAVPKMDELVATPYRHGSKENAEKFFMEGMTKAMGNLATHTHGSAPLTIYYAFKQTEHIQNDIKSPGWISFLEAVLQSGLTITGTWPMRTELGNRLFGSGTNALASSIILVCRPRAKDAGTISRRQFVRMLNETLPAALDAMTRESEGLHSPVAPVDLSQAIIGPGMAIFSRYEAVLEADGTPMSVKTALQLINRFLAEADFDADTQFCLHWFEQHGWEVGKFGEADTLARAKGTSVDGVRMAGCIEAGGGNVRLLRWREYAEDWNPAADNRLAVWEVLHQLIRTYYAEGDSGASRVLSAVAAKAEAARQLAYRLYTLCERKGWAEEARAYNEVVAGWSGIETAAQPGPENPQYRLTDVMQS